MQYVQRPQQQNVQYVQRPPPQNGAPRQYTQSGGNGVYVMPTNDGMQYTTTTAVPAPVVTTVPVTTRVVNDGRNTTTVVRRTTNMRDVTSPRVEMQMAANIILAGFLLLSFQPDRAVSNIDEANVLALQLVAFGCFLSAVCFYIMFLQRGGKTSMRIWVYCAQILFMLGLVLLIAAVAITSRIQLGEEYETIWIASITTMIILVGLPIICDIVFCAFRLLMSGVDALYDLW